ncbi:MAG: glycosyltransferase [Gammaproteobacteria bacterium]
MYQPYATIVLLANGAPEHLQMAVHSLTLMQTLPHIEILALYGTWLSKQDPEHLEQCRSILEAEALQDDRVQLIDSGNRQLADCLNLALESASGRYMGRMNGQDLSHPERIETQTNMLERFAEVHTVATHRSSFDYQGEYPHRTVYRLCKKLSKYTKNSRIKPWHWLVFDLTTAMHRTEQLKQIGGWRAAFGPCPEYDLAFRLRQQGTVMAVLAEPLYLRRLPLAAPKPFLKHLYYGSKAFIRSYPRNRTSHTAES